MDKSFADRLKQLCDDYYNDYMDVPLCPVSSYERMNSLLRGTRKPTMDELVKISDVTILQEPLREPCNQVSKAWNGRMAISTMCGLCAWYNKRILIVKQETPNGIHTMGEAHGTIQRYYWIARAIRPEGCRRHRNFLRTGQMEVEKTYFDMLLIDDMQRDIRNWIAMGGTGIAHISPEETIRQLNEMDALYEALEASILLADTLRTTEPELIGLIATGPDTAEVPLFEVKGGRLLQAGFTPLPGDLDESYEYVKAENDIAVASVKKLPKQGIWESEMIRLMEPVQDDDPEETPYYPLLLLVVESQSYYMLPVSIVRHGDENPQEMLRAFADACKKQKVYPKEIRCRDERTYALLKDFCERTGVKISIYKREMPALEEAENAILDHIRGVDGMEILDRMAEVIEAILSMSKDELKLMPKPLLDQLKMMILNNVFPEEITVELEKKLKGI